VRVDDHDVVVSASIGIAIAEEGSDAESLVSDADLAMYRAKQRGRARAVLYDEAMRVEVVSRLAIEEALRDAVGAAEINVVFQPVVDIATRVVVGVEALARWRDDRFGDVPPPEFLAVAEEAGLVDDLGGLVLNAAVATAARLRRECDEHLTVAVNVSARQLAGTRLLDQLAAALRDHDLPPSALIVELTETDVLDDHLAGPSINALRALGVGVSIDDFGTGYSSLQRVARLPVDEVKIDQSFVAGLGKDRGADAVVRAAITLADSLGMRLVAEGIEREDQLELLASMGCQYGQGWLFTAPLPEAELIEWLRSPAAGDRRAR
jgi:EAL domain-containing protein (putative c-di-GMP-specific phosphodiesterase class I)